MALNLEDLIPDFPLQDDPLFAAKITAKKEFSMLKLSNDQEPVQPGELFRSQQFVKQMLSTHSTVEAQFVIHDVGTGKTCAATAVAEAMKNNLIGPGRKKALIVVKGDTVAQSFKDNLIYVCTTGEYLPSEEKERTLTGQRNVITKNINEYYEIVHYIKLARTISQLSDAEIEREYSDRVIIFDESHNLRMGYFAPAKGKKKGVVSEEEREMRDAKVYDNVWRMLHVALRKKVLLLSATPVVDRAEEFGLQANLLLPESLQIPADYDWDNPDMAYLEPRLRGLITYVRSSTDVPIVKDMGEVVYLPNPVNEEDGDIQIKLVKTPMSYDQYLQYKKYAGKGSKRIPNENEDDLSEAVEEAEEKSGASSAFRRDERYASMFIFPRTDEEGERAEAIENDERLSDDQKTDTLDRLDLRRDAVGTSAFNSRIEVAKNGEYNIRPNEPLADYLKEPTSDDPDDPDSQDRLRILSAKVHAIVTEVKVHPQELAFIYTEFVKGPGAILIGLSFENRGYERYSGEEMYIGNSRSNDSGSSGSGRKVRLSKKKRYAVISGSSRPSYVKNALEIFRSPENRYGEYMQVLIGSNVTREGISFKNVRQVHVAHPFWNDVPVYQAIGRALRERAQMDLPPSERYVKVYKHVAVGSNGEEDTVDMQMYAWSESKRYRIARILRLAKRIATDCSLNKVRNQQRGEEDYSRGCDYDTCEYSCVGSEVTVDEQPIAPLPPDDSTYFLYYSAEVLQQIKAEIKEMFKSQVSLTLANINASINYDSKYILQALNEIIRHNEPVYSEFGKISFLKEIGDSYFLQFDISEPEESLAQYTHNVSVVNHKTLADFILPLREDENTRIVREAEALNPTSPDFKDAIIEIGGEEIKATLVERSIIAELNSTATPFNLAITDLFADRWYMIEENPFTQQPEQIIFHDMLTQIVDRAGYNITTKTHTKSHLIRVLQGDVWRYVTPEEANVFYNLIREIDEAKKKERFTRNRIYGIISTIDGGFRIEQEVATADRRKLKRGRTCADFPARELVDMMSELGINPPPIVRPISKSAMITALAKTSYKLLDFSTVTDQRILYLYAWSKVAGGRASMCEAIRAHFTRVGSLYYV